MTSFTFTPAQLGAAPPEVRRWIVREIAQALAAFEPPSHDPSQVEASAPAACTADEALHVFNVIRNNFVLTQVFFELARDASPGRRVPPLHALSIEDILRHTRLNIGDRLIECFTAINEAFRQVRRDPEATLFGFDSHGHVYVHEVTHLSVQGLWEQLVRPASPAAAEAVSRAAPSDESFASPHPGPSDNTAPYAAEPPSPRDLASEVNRSSGGLGKDAPLEAAPVPAVPVIRRPPRQPDPVPKALPVPKRQPRKPSQSATSRPAPEVSPAPTPKQPATKPRSLTSHVSRRRVRSGI